MTGSNFKYDVFLCHNDKDKPIIERIYDILEKEKYIRPFLDKNHLPPGHPWQDNIADAIIEQVASLVTVHSLCYCFQRVDRHCP